MLSTDLIYFFSFIIFIFLAYRLGFKYAKQTLNHEIQKISHTLDQAHREKDLTLDRLHELKQQVADLQNGQQAHKQQLEARGLEITEKHREHLENLLKEREHFHQELLAQEMRLHMKSMKEEMLTYATQELIKKIESHEKYSADFEKKSLEMLKVSSMGS